MQADQEIFKVKKGDIVSIYNRDYIVEEVVKLGVGVNSGLNCLIKDGAESSWLCARNYGQTVLVQCSEITLENEPPGRTVTVDGVTFTLRDQGQTRATATSSMGYPKYVHLEYYDYLDSDQSRYLFVQRAGGKTLALLGEPVINTALMIFPRAD